MDWWKIHCWGFYIFWKNLIYILKKVGLDVNNCWGQDYDGAVNRSSEAVGVQRIIKNNGSEKSVYTHCCGHNLALVICTACKLVMIRNALDTVKDTCMMFVRGSKKLKLLRDVVKENPHFSERHKPIFDICVTVWVKKRRWLQHVFNSLSVYYRGSRSYGMKTTSREIQ